MKVYIVTSGCYSDYGIVNVFDEYEKALAYIDAKNPDRYDDYYVEIYDTAAVEVKERRKRFRVKVQDGLFSVREITEDSESVSDTYSPLFYAEKKYIWPDKKNRPRYRQRVVDYYYTDVLAEDKDRALKIAQDRWAKNKAEIARL